jgi:hypothetical protein
MENCWASDSWASDSWAAGSWREWLPPPPPSNGVYLIIDGDGNVEVKYCTRVTKLGS